MSAKTSFYNLHVVIVSDELDKSSQKYETRILPIASRNTSPMYIVPIRNDMAKTAIKNNMGIIVNIECDCVNMQKNYAHNIEGYLFIPMGSDSVTIEIQRDLNIIITESGKDNLQHKHIKDKISCTNNDDSITKVLSDILTAIENLDISAIA